MTKYQKQLIVALSSAILCFLAMHLKFPSQWINGMCIVLFTGFLCWIFELVVSMAYYSNFGKWLSEDDK